MAERDLPMIGLVENVHEPLGRAACRRHGAPWIYYRTASSIILTVCLGIRYSLVLLRFILT